MARVKPYRQRSQGPNRHEHVVRPRRGWEQNIPPGNKTAQRLGLVESEAPRPTEPERPPKVWGYVRMSTDKQGMSPETQKQTIGAWINAHGLKVDAFFADQAVSGSLPMAKRPAGGEMLAKVRRGDTVIFAKLDRAFRSVVDAYQTIEAWDRQGIKVVFCDLGVDASTIQGKLVLQIFAAFAEFERSVIGMRTREGLAARKKQGFAYCRFPGYGFKWKSVRLDDGSKSKVRVPDEEERKVMKYIVQARLKEPPVPWVDIKAILDEGNIVVSRTGKPWTVMRIRRAFKAELLLQVRETPKNH